MKVIIKGEIKDYQITSVILSSNISDPDNVRLFIFHCVNCGNKLIQYQGFVARIIPGLSPIPLTTILRCKNCKHNYSFQSSV